MKAKQIEFNYEIDRKALIRGISRHLRDCQRILKLLRMEIQKNDAPLAVRHTRRKAN